MEEFLSEQPENPAWDSVIKELVSKRRVNGAGKEYWRAREIHAILGYSEYDVFNGVIKRAIKGCTTNKVRVENHFLGASAMVSIGSGAERKVGDYYLSRLACYLIAMEGDARKTEIAAAKAYFAIQTRKQEIFEEMPAETKRLAKRKQVAKNYSELSKTAVGSGVKRQRLGVFHDKGYRGLYDDRSRRTVNRMKGLPEDANLMDYAGYEELAAHDFKNTQTARRLKTLNVKTEEHANQIHYETGRDVRNMIAKYGNPMPETLAIEADIKKVERRVKRQLGGGNE